jgi:hypothetical protein
MTIEELTQALIQHRLATPQEIRGCTLEEIDRLERHFGITLPQMYRSFLLKMGHSSGYFMAGTHTTYQFLFSLRDWAVEMLENESLLIEQGIMKPEHRNFVLPGEAFVFAMHQGYVIYYFRLDEGPNPPVYYYIEGEGTSTRDTESFMDYLHRELKAHL